MDALRLAKVDNFLLGKQWVVLDLVDGRHDGGLCEQLLEVLDRVICDANGLYFVWDGLDELLEVLPGVDVGYAAVEITGAVFVFGEERVVSFASISKSRTAGKP